MCDGMQPEININMYHFKPQNEKEKKKDWLNHRRQVKSKK